MYVQLDVDKRFSPLAFFIFQSAEHTGPRGQCRTGSATRPLHTRFLWTPLNPRKLRDYRSRFHLLLRSFLVFSLGQPSFLFPPVVSWASGFPVFDRSTTHDAQIHYSYCDTLFLLFIIIIIIVVYYYYCVLTVARSIRYHEVEEVNPRHVLSTAGISRNAVAKCDNRQPRAFLRERRECRASSGICEGARGLPDSLCLYGT